MNDGANGGDGATPPRAGGSAGDGAAAPPVTPPPRAGAGAARRRGERRELVLYALALAVAGVPLAILGTLGVRQLTRQEELGEKLRDERERAVLARVEQGLLRRLGREERAIFEPGPAPARIRRVLEATACRELVGDPGELSCPPPRADAARAFLIPPELVRPGRPAPPPVQLAGWVTLRQALLDDEPAARARAEEQLRDALLAWLGGVQPPDPEQLEQIAAELQLNGREPLARQVTRLHLARLSAEAAARTLGAELAPLLVAPEPGSVARRATADGSIVSLLADGELALGLELDAAALQAAVSRELPPGGGRLAILGPGPGPATTGLQSSRELGVVAQGLRATYADHEAQELLAGAAGQRRLFAGFALLLAAVAGAGAFLTARAGANALRLARLQREFVASVSHELRTPLSMIRLFAETLQLGRARDEEERSRFLGIIAREGERLSVLIDEMLDFARIEAGTKQYRIAAGDLGALVRQTCDDYRPTLAGQGFELEAEVGEGLGAVPHDPGALKQALLNLLQNGVKYTEAERPGARRLLVRARREGGSAVIEVIDHGIGVPPGERRKIFERFFRGSDPLVAARKGTGLGLAFVAHALAAHGGEAQVFSQQGRGSIFSLHLPAEGAAGEEAAAPERAAPEA